MYRNLVSKIYNELTNFLFPEKCLFCGFSGEICCEKCFSEIPENVNFKNNILSIYYYSHPKINKLIWQLKYHHTGSVAKVFGGVMAEKLEKIFFPIFPPTTQNIYLIPIPLNQSDRRLHNHAELLANEIKVSLETEIPRRFAPAPLERGPSAQEHFSPNIFVLNNLLFKNSKQKQSHTKSRQERLENVKNAFSINPQFVSSRQNAAHFAAPPHSFQNNLYIIVDDVTTTNATINSARKTLSQFLQIQESKILAITIAH